MKRRSTPILQIGIFTLVGFTVLIVFIFFIGNKKHIFSSTSTIYARFANVSGLKTGSPVEMAGISEGSVTEIKLPKKASDSVSVTMKIENDAMPLIHSDSKATITSSGLVGEKYITITIGGDSSPVLSPGSMVQGVPARDYFASVSDTLNVAVSQVNQLTHEAVEILKNVRTGHGSLGKLIYDEGLYNDLHGLTETVRGSFNKVTTSFDTLSNQMGAIATRINSGQGSIGKIISSDDLYNDMKATTENIKLSSYDIRDAMAKLALGTGRIAEDAEALKHNFLFKGYFEDRGYWDAPDFERTIDRKLDSLSHLNQRLDDQLRELRMRNGKPATPTDSH